MAGSGKDCRQTGWLPEDREKNEPVQELGTADGVLGVLTVGADTMNVASLEATPVPQLSVARRLHAASVGLAAHSVKFFAIKLDTFSPSSALEPVRPSQA